MLRTLPCLLLAFGIAAADEPKDAAGWVEELSKTYAKLDGFTATYASKGEGKSLETVMGMDEISHLAALHMTATKNGRTMENRQWITDNDELFAFVSPAELMVISGVQTELNSLVELTTAFAAFPADKALTTFQMTPSMLISKESIHPECHVKTSGRPSWEEMVQEAKVEASDPKSVTFLTKEHGQLTVSRETALLVRQSVTADDGEVRVLELKEHRINPGKEAILKISQGWKTEGAKVVARGAMLAGLRLEVFQAIVTAADEGKMDLAKLEKLLGEQRDALRRFGDGFTSEAGGSLAGAPFWKEMLDGLRDKMRIEWLARAGEFDEKEFETQLANPKLRWKIRDDLAADLDVEKSRERVMFEIFGKMGGAELKAKGEAGQAARKLVESALVRGYNEAVLERKMTKHWGERAGMD